LTDLAEFTHFVTRVKIIPTVADDPAFIEIERVRGRAFAEKLSMRVLSRTWQMLFKGITEVAAADRPLSAAEMVLVRIAYAADLPTPDEAIRSLDEKGSSPRAAASASPPAAAGSAPRPLPYPSPRAGEGRVGGDAPRGAPNAAVAPAREPIKSSPSGATLAPLVVARFEDLIALAGQKRDLAVKLALERDVRLVRCEDGRLEITLEPSAAKTLVNDLARKFSEWTRRQWMVVVSAEEGQPTLKSQIEARRAELKSGVGADPLVQAVLARFPGAEIVDVRKGELAGTHEPSLNNSRPDAQELAHDDEAPEFGDQLPHSGDSDD
jgi:DNA polymerase III subunit gamma/tau